MLQPVKTHFKQKRQVCDERILKTKSNLTNKTRQPIQSQGYRAPFTEKVAHFQMPIAYQTLTLTRGTGRLVPQH